MADCSFHKCERLCGQMRIQALYKEGKRFVAWPLRVSYMPTPEAATTGAHLGAEIALQTCGRQESYAQADARSLSQAERPAAHRYALPDSVQLYGQDRATANGY